jgi:hypothetical protein
LGVKNLKRTLQVGKARPDHGDVALLAWKIAGNLIALIIVASIAAMIPEMVRYLKLKSM